MREIKFRAWMKYGQVGGIDGMIYSENKLGDFFDHKLNRIAHKLMQFTGLRDKNGKEIYEGDMYRVEKETDSLDNRYYVICVWLQEISCFGWLSDGEYINWQDNGFGALEDEGIPFNCYKGDCENLEIIGNIYEKPELLK